MMNSNSENESTQLLVTRSKVAQIYDSTKLHLKHELVSHYILTIDGETTQRIQTENLLHPPPNPQFLLVSFQLREDK